MEQISHHTRKHVSAVSPMWMVVGRWAELVTGMGIVATISVSMLLLGAVGCATESPHDRSYVSEGIRQRTDYGLGPTREPGQFSVPEGVSFGDGLSLDEAVALALWNNAQLQVDLAALGFARADLIEADMLPNPVFTLLFPVGPKLLETRLLYPVDILWQRPHRVAAAKYNAHSLSESLIENGLGLIRDVQKTYTDLWLAQEHARLAEEDVRFQSEMACLAQRRLEAGDISELAASAVHVRSLETTDVARRFSKDVIVLRQRFRVLLGSVPADTMFDILPPDANVGSVVPVDELVETALAARPDLRAAELDIEAAGERLGWERSKVFNFILWIDGKDKGEDSLEIGPGFQVEIPILNQNSGRVARARAELEMAVRQYEVVRQEIILQVHEAHAEYTSACEEFDLWDRDVIPALEAASGQARRSLAVGEVSYARVLEAEGQLLKARVRRVESMAHLHRSIAQLDYVVGKRMM